MPRGQVKPPEFQIDPLPKPSMPSFPSLGYTEFDWLMSHEEKLVRQSVRQFVDSVQPEK
jgi:hypothetical protein